MNPPAAAPTGYPIDMMATLTSRRRVFENSAATALIAASMPPMPRPVTIRQIERSASRGSTSSPNSCECRRHETAEHAARRRDHEHAGRHHDEAAEHRRPAADLVRDAAEEDRAERHADELHRQHEAERARLQPPLGPDPGRSEADGKHVEAIERVQTDGDRHDEHLHRGHRRLGDYVSRISYSLAVPRRCLLQLVERERSIFRAATALRRKFLRIANAALLVASNTVFSRPHCALDEKT